jgi:CheY-like chemotaxis protein/anti-sigma regulatory factor (Ser/Thr protein kinase)
VVTQALNVARARWGSEPGAPAIELREELAAQLPEVEGVEKEIREALANVILNAADAMPEGGALTVRTGVRPNAAGADEVFVETTDEGRGMDEETQRHCLEPFFTTKGERGTGLGLAIVYGMAQRHGAKIDIESAPGRGTTVRLRFTPAASRAGGAKTNGAGAEEEAPSRRILVVDDDPALLKSLQEVLERDGYYVESAEGGQAGIERFRAALGNHPFDTVITDLGMPEVDGRMVAEAVKGASPKTGVIMLTGWGRRMHAEGERPAQVDVLLSKPCKLRELREALGTVGAGVGK